MASVRYELIWGFFMNGKKVTIALIGSGLPLSVCAAFLAEKLQYLKPVIVAIQLPQEEREPDLAFAFAPFAESITPILRRQLAEASLQKIEIFTSNAPSGFAFNFAPYGVVSGAVTFSHAYQICRQHAADVSSYDSFLGVKPPPSPGIVYVRQHVAAEFQRLSVRKGVIYVPCESVSVALSDDHKKILAIETSTQQIIAADYFIDCSPDGVVMQCLQTKTAVSDQIIPLWSLTRRQCASASTTTAFALKFDRANVSCIGDHGGERHEKIYDFGGAATSSEYFEQAWLGNCVTIGCGFARIPEFIIDLDRLLERQLGTLSWLLGANSENTYSARHYNMLSMRHLNEAIDTVNLLLQASLDESLELTLSNRRRVALFQSSANTVKENNSLISENCWTGLLHAAGYSPRDTNAVSVATDPKRIIDLTKSLILR